MDVLKNTYLQINLDALVANYHFFKKQIGKSTKVMAVVKAFAYGHEAVSIAQKLEKEGVAYFAVAFTSEGIHLRKAGIKTPILILHPQPLEVLDCIQYKLEPTIYSFRVLQSFKEHTHQALPVHLKFNTGLNRLGFAKKDIDAVQSGLSENPHLQLTSIFSHLIASEDPAEKELTQGQIKAYQNIITAFKKTYKEPFIQHLANTSGTLNYPQARFDMVRIGIGLYGYANAQKWTNQLQNVGSLYTVISQIHTVTKGDSVGYNRGFIAAKKTVTATLPIGHADGIPRTWGKGKGFVMINNQIAPIVGNVCMDMIMVDVSEIDCKEGDPVILFDTQTTVEKLALATQTISYEVLTAISQRVPRMITTNT